MKKTLLSVAFLIVGTFGVLAQGVVQFDNGSWNAWPGAAVDRWVYADSVGGTLLNDPAYTAALWQNAGGTWSQLGDALPFGSPDAEPGAWAWDFLDRTATSSTLQVRIYRSGVEVAASDPFQYTKANSIPPSPGDVLMVNFRAFAVPEPSTIALGVLGLGALLLFRRRK